MSKELETFSKERQALDELYDVAGNIKNLKEDYIILKTALNRLESIDNSNPSEALKCLEKVYSRLPQWDLSRNVDQCNIIKQALLKAQEPKHYLKWEELEFKEETSRIEVKLNETLYTLSYVKRQYLDFVYLINNDSQIRLNSANDKQFFNDLHLERVEE